MKESSDNMTLSRRKNMEERTMKNQTILQNKSPLP